MHLTLRSLSMTVFEFEFEFFKQVLMDQLMKELLKMMTMTVATVQTITTIGRRIYPSGSRLFTDTTRTRMKEVRLR